MGSRSTLARPLLLAVAAALFLAAARGNPPWSTLPMDVKYAQGLSGTRCNASTTGGPHRAHFPKDVLWGAATSAYQVEGAWDTDGRGPSIWDTFVLRSGKIRDGFTGQVASDQYHHVEEDVWILKTLGFTSYRFSISWSRVLPLGAGKPNEAGISYYNRLINALLKAGIEPAVTLYHWDLPQALQDKYGGWLSSKVIPDFTSYAALCFSRFGDRVKIWITFNEIQEVANLGYVYGVNAPGRCSDRTRCGAGNSTTEPFLVVHNCLLAHAGAAKVYRTQFQKKQGGQIGIAGDATWFEPFNNSKDSQDASDRGMLFQYGWWANPVVYGDYPAVMKALIPGSILPCFSAEQKQLLKASVDFLGLNFYTASYIYSTAKLPFPSPLDPLAAPLVWARIGNYYEKDGVPIGEKTASSWLTAVPWGISRSLKWVSKTYPGFPIMVTENGVSQPGNLTKPAFLCDEQRVRFYKNYLSEVLKATQAGVPLKAYYAWSILDNFEWAAGYLERFGIVYVDFNNPNRPRTPKASALWWQNFLALKN